MQEQQEVPYAQFPINIKSTMGAVHKQRHFKGGWRRVFQKDVLTWKDLNCAKAYLCLRFCQIASAKEISTFYNYVNHYLVTS